MKRILLTAAVIAATTPAFADKVNATIEDKYTIIYEQKPITRQECVTVDVPIYGTTQGSGASGGDVLTGMIIGGLLGKGVTGKDNGAAAGAVMGGIIAADKGQKQKQVVTGYKQERRCDNVTYYENIEKTVYSHSIIRWSVNGRKFEATFVK